MDPYSIVLRALNDAGIRYLVVGGLAVTLHGFRRFTADIDLLLALDEENLEKMSGLMKRMGYIERLPIPVTALKSRKQVQQFLTEKGMTAYTFLSNDERHINIDVLAGKSLQFTDFDQRKVTVNLGEGLRIPVVSLNDLLDMKREANRPQDGVDIERLLQLKEL